MSDIDLQVGKINYQDQWLSIEDLTGKIQTKMKAGDMKFSDLAAALEELNIALENSHTIETKIVIPTADYEKLKELGEGDDRTCVHRAVMAFIAGDSRQAPPSEPAEPDSEPAIESKAKKKKAIKCTKCKATIELPTDERPTEIQCPECGTMGRLKAPNKA